MGFHVITSWPDFAFHVLTPVSLVAATLAGGTIHLPRRDDDD